MKIILSNDPYSMNWLREDFPYAEVSCPQGLMATVGHRMEGDELRTTIRIANVSGKPLFTNQYDLSVTLPLEDRYESTELCLRRRALVHLFCGGNVAWALALRMGGEPPHLGFALTEGSLAGYSVRHNGPLANDRGCLELHPSGDEWAPGEVKTLSWVLFPCAGREDFFARLGDYCRYVRVEASRYVLFPSETATLTIRTSFPASRVCVDGMELSGQDGLYSFDWHAAEPDERTFRVEADGVSTWCRVLVTPDPAALAAQRTRFIRDQQQYRGPIAAANGAYLAYDNDEDRMILNPVNDFNGGRERVGMGVLMACWLQREDADPDGSLRESLEAYTAYVLRELVDEATGQVFNDLCRDGTYKRNYNYPWFARFFLERHRLTGEARDLETAYRIVRHFYEDEGGARFYPIELPLADMALALAAAGRDDDRRRLIEWARAHADAIAGTGVNYPPHEVAFEQSIIAPAADVCLQAFELTGTAKYLDSAREHLRLLELFNGSQPDWHQNEVAIRNWDGYWFGKWQIFGDTFPHYWSALTGRCFARYARLTGETRYARRAEASLRAVLPLIFPDGRASCACVYPLTSNGVRAALFDPRANDQDWGLYFALSEDL